MKLSAFSLSAIEKRWAPKVFRAVDSFIDAHFSQVMPDRTIRYSVSLHDAGPTIRLITDPEGNEGFEIVCNGSDWDNIESAMPKAREQILGGLIALSDDLHLPKDELGMHCASMGIRPAQIHVLPPLQPMPRAGEHPRARTLLPDEIFWDRCNDYGPVGGDTGADVIGMYEEWRVDHSPRDRDAFFEQLLKSWNCSQDVEDDILITSAVAQLTFDGNVSAAIRRRAFAAVDRQQSTTVISDRGWSDPKIRRRALDLVRNVLERAPVDD